MRFICDLHIHSRYAQGCSRDISIAQLEKWAKVKGIDVLGTGDATHPEWRKELRETLVRESDGIFYTAGGQAFILQTEISLIYTQGRGRRIHLVVLFPSFDAIEKVVEYLLRFGRLDYDGRPIFKIPAHQFVRDLRAIDERIEIIPAHAWTPWFSLFGSFSGFDSIKECFQDQTSHINAIETGISSDVEMNDRLDQLKSIRYVSFSDSHSYWPWRLGREATVFDLKTLTYDSIIGALRTGKGFWGTIEVDPGYGKYHYDGHRACNVVMSPEETIRHKGICPVCKQPLTIGVLYRVDELADRSQKEGLTGHSQQFYKLIPLHEILSLMLGQAMTTKKVWAAYWDILKAGKNEYDILLNATEKQLLAVTTPEITKAILAVREGNIHIKPGYDGVYGVLEIPGVQLRPVATKGEESPQRGRPKKVGANAAETVKKRRGRPPKQRTEPVLSPGTEPQKGLTDFF